VERGERERGEMGSRGGVEGVERGGNGGREGGLSFSQGGGSGTWLGAGKDRISREPSNPVQPIEKQRNREGEGERGRERSLSPVLEAGEGGPLRSRREGSRIPSCSL